MQDADNDNREDEAMENAAGRKLSPAAMRALKEAEERRRLAPAPDLPPETGGRGGAEPARFGDYEINGRAIDF